MMYKGTDTVKIIANSIAVTIQAFLNNLKHGNIYLLISGSKRVQRKKLRVITHLILEDEKG